MLSQFRLAFEYFKVGDEWTLRADVQGRLGWHFELHIHHKRIRLGVVAVGYCRLGFNVLDAIVSYTSLFKYPFLIWVTEVRMEISAFPILNRLQPLLCSHPLALLVMIS
jgi:hypothetical protein